MSRMRTAVIATFCHDVVIGLQSIPDSRIRKLVMTNTFNRQPLGIAVVGAGRIGSMRARLAAQHPAVRFLAISDLKPEAAQALADKAGAQFVSGDNREVIAHPAVNTVIVSTS